MAMRQGERNALPGRDGELADRGELLAAQLRTAVQHNHIGPGNRAQSRVALEMRHPRHRGAVIEPQCQVEAHRHMAAAAFDDPHHRRTAGGGGHEVDQRDAAFLGFEYRLQDHRAGPVLPADSHRRRGGGDAPAPVVGRADQRGKAGRAVEARPAQPVDRAVAADQRGAVAVADHRVVFDPRRVARGGGGRRIARVVLGLFGRAGAGRTGHQVARPQIRPCAVVQSAAKASGRNRIGIARTIMLTSLPYIVAGICRRALPGCDVRWPPHAAVR